MNAVLLNDFGSVDNLVYTTSADKLELDEVVSLKPTEVLVRVKACALSEYDVQVRQGKFATFSKLNKTCIGFEVAGLVEKRGQDVTGFEINDSVAGLVPLDSEHAASAELCLLDVTCIVHIPKGVSFERAAASVLAGLRCYTAFHYMHHLQLGDVLFVPHGAHGSSHYALQYAAAVLGARVITTVSSDEELNYVQNLQVEIARIIDTRRELIVTSILEETGGQGVDLVLDSPIICETLADDVPTLQKAHNMALEDCLQFMAPHAKFLTPNSAHSSLSLATCNHMLLKGISLGFLFEQVHVLSQSQQGRFLHILSQVLDNVAKEIIDVKIEHIFPLEKIREAHRHLHGTSKPTVGKIVIRI